MKKSKHIIFIALILGVLVFAALCTTAQTPTITKFSPDSGSIGTLLTVTGTNLNGATSLTVGGVPAIVVSSSAFTVVAMVMPGTNTGTITTATVNGNATSSGSFKVTANSVVFKQQGSKLLPDPYNPVVHFGTSVAISADGNTSAVTGWDNTISGGAIWVYTRTDSTWTQEAELWGADEIDTGRQGFRHVALSADGNTALFGVPQDSLGYGAVYVFTRSGGVWTQQGNKLMGSGAVGPANMGSAVALSADGNTAVIGGGWDSSIIGQYRQVGAVWVFKRIGSTWTQVGNKLVGTGGAGWYHQQGANLAISADGNTFVEGDPADSFGVGAFWVFSNNGGLWTQQGSKMVGTGYVNNSVAYASPNQGGSVAISADGNTIMEGGNNDNTLAGAVWVFTRTNGVWTQQGNKIVCTNTAGLAYFGSSVALTADGNTAAIGGVHDSTWIGAVWVFTRSGGVWSQTGSKLVGTGVSSSISEQGGFIALSADGNTMIESGDGDSTNRGAVWIFTGPIPPPPPPPTNLAPSISSFSPASGLVGSLVTITGNYLDSITSLTIGGIPAIVVSSNYTTVVAMVMPGTIMGTINLSTRVGTAVSSGNFTVTASTGFPNAQQGGKLVGTGIGGTTTQDKEGTAVALSADGNTAIVGAPGDSTVGAAFVYIRTGGIWIQQGKRLAGTGATGYSLQGSSVALSADGNTAIIGGYGDNKDTGAVWIFVRNALGKWKQQGNKLVGTGITNASIGAKFGYSLALSADGNTLVVGGSGDIGGNGSIWVFTRSGGVWTQLGIKFNGSGAINSGGGGVGLGTSIAISADGKTIIAGGPGDNNNYGAVWIFSLSGGVWTQQGGKLLGSSTIGNKNYLLTGTSVSISADGNTAIVGTPYDNNFKGSATLLTRTAGVWKQQGDKIVGLDTTGTQLQGTSVTMSADGNTAFVGGNYTNNVVGAVWAFTRTAAVWSQAFSKLIGTGAVGNSLQGSSIALSADGNTLIVGGYGDNSSTGAAWVDTTAPVPPPAILSFNPTTATAGTTDTIRGHTFFGISSVSFGDTTASSFKVINDSTILAVVGKGASGSVKVVSNSGTSSKAGFNYFFCKTPVLNKLTVSGCDSVMYNHKVYTITSIEKDTVKNAYGCDSLYNTVTIMVNKLTPKTSFMGLTNCDSVTYKGKVYKTSTNFIDTVKSITGCDSVYNTVNIVIVNLGISGRIQYPNAKSVPNLFITVSGVGAHFGMFSGSYSFGCLNQGTTSTVTVNKLFEVSKSNGVNSLDIALIQSHILGKTKLNSPYKIIAADVNGDGKVNSLDIVYIKRLILGLDTTFTSTATKQKRLWAFVDSSYKFPDSTIPFPFNDSIVVKNLNSFVKNQTFIGCKLGDVNWDWNPAKPRPMVNNTDAVELSYEPIKVSPDRASDGYLHIPVKVKNFKEMQGLQFTLSFNASNLQWQGIKNNTLGLEMGTNHAAEGSVSFVWIDPSSEIKTLEDGSILMELVFKAIQPLNKETLDINSSITTVAAYDKDNNEHNIILKPSLINTTEIEAESWMVFPNPTKGGIINVQLNLKDKKTIVLRLLDNSGKLLLVKKVEGVKGNNKITLRENNMAVGSYYLQAVGVEGEVVKKIIIQ